GSSELYEHLSLKIAEDEEMLKLSSYAQKGQPVPNLLFGAIHYLLLQGKEHVLKDYYPSIVTSPKEIESSFIPFKDFCQVYRDEIICILESKLVQTNEVRRCAYLYPTFCYIYEKVKKPLALIEIGTSAGLQLLWDKYSYSYGTKEIFGDLNSDVHITSEMRADRPPILFHSAPPVSERIGIDLHINDLTDKEDYLWLMALIWPNHNERRKLFEKSSHFIKATPIKFIEGDGVALISKLSNQIPRDSVLCIFHTHVANQIPLENKKKLLEEIKAIGSDRDVFHLYNNMNDGDLHLDYFIKGKENLKTIGKTDGHGRWFEWKME
ncbi:MAG: DUF2332 domain-containing protein, partial [Bacillota bacterium]|nr:DUF2332 domain-containing protein [Bacillota bacterium]